VDANQTAHRLMCHIVRLADDREPVAARVSRKKRKENPAAVAL
jgi:hypothetical protein